MVYIVYFFFMLCTAAVATATKYIITFRYPRPLHGRGPLRFVLVGFCELAIYVVVEHLLGYSTYVLGLGMILTPRRLFALMATLYSALAILPNALLLKDDSTQTLRQVFSSRNVLHAWMLGFIFAGLRVLTMYLGSLLY